MGTVMLIIQIVISTVLPVCLYLWFSKKIKRQFPAGSGSRCNIPDIHFLLKRWWAERCITAKEEAEETNFGDYEDDCQANPRMIMDENSCDSLLFYGADQKGNSLFLKYARRGRRMAEVSLQFITSDGRVYVLPDYPNTVVTSCSNQEWSAIGLKIEQLEHQRRWRIIYNGMLRNLIKGQEPCDENIEHVRLNFVFIAATDTLLWPADWSPKLHADALARDPWKSPEWSCSKLSVAKVREANAISALNFRKLMDYKGYDLWGSVIGQVIFKDSSISALYLRGLFQRRRGKHESHQFHKGAILCGIMSAGDLCYLGASNTKQSFSLMQFGHFRDSSETMNTVDRVDLQLNNFTDDKCIVNSRHNIYFTACGKDYSVDVKLGNSITLYHGKPWGWTNKLINVKLKLNGRTGTGIMQLWQPYSGPCKMKERRKIRYLQPPNTFIQRDDYVVSFDDGKCQNENIVGGKGSSLAALTSIEDADFAVPKGFCVTILALELQLQTHEELQHLIDEIEDISARKKDGDLKAHCEKTVRVIESTPVVEPVKEAILRSIEELESSLKDLDSDLDTYAIRSSAVGEDSEDTSAAGQNSTYLGVKGADNIIKSVAKCWASLFSYQSVEYRKQHGLLAKASMGVCVQRMVNAEAAGVMFTRHPTTGDPSNIVITANYGLGESVVSAMIEPDTITVYRSWDDKLSVKNTTIGSKTHKISISNTGVAASALDEKETRQACISERIALRLAAVGLHVEASFGNSRDIEWAIVGEKILLLQARPITTIYTWTDFELTHELDSGVNSDQDILTFANVGEVIPNPLSPLSVSTVLKALHKAVAMKNGNYYRPYLHVSAGRVAMNYYNCFVPKIGKEITLMHKIADIAVCGKVAITPEIHQRAVERNGVVTAKQQLLMMFDMFKEAWLNSTVVHECKETNDDEFFDADNFHTAYSLYNEITRNFWKIEKVSYCHTFTSRVSIVYQVFAMGLLMNGYEDFMPDHFTDIATVLRSCSDVVSSEVPVLLKLIACAIQEAGKAEEFQKIKPANANEWLQTNCPSAAKLLEKLIREHGHRCIQEFDLATEPWSLKPDSLIVTIQTLTETVQEYNPSKKLSVEETVASLKTPKSQITKWFIKKIIPFCRSAVEHRETTKSLAVKVIHNFKFAFRKLGALMVSEGYLPCEDLIFFLTYQEIGQMLKNRSPTLVQKAQRRKRLYARLAELRYPEFNTGVPIPITTKFDATAFEQSAKIQGTSACAGSVLGRACVITDLSEAGTIQQGDILITRATDVGWTPYFPLLSGIVTELGGLISHGAVVAREYGIPSVIGVAGATELLKTGDTVLLAADVGALHLIKRA